MRLTGSALSVAVMLRLRLDIERSEKRTLSRFEIPFLSLSITKVIPLSWNKQLLSCSSLQDIPKNRLAPCRLPYSRSVNLSRRTDVCRKRMKNSADCSRTRRRPTLDFLRKHCGGLLYLRTQISVLTVITRDVKLDTKKTCT